MPTQPTTTTDLDCVTPVLMAATEQDWTVVNDETHQGHRTVVLAKANAELIVRFHPDGRIEAATKTLWRGLDDGGVAATYARGAWPAGDYATRTIEGDRHHPGRPATLLGEVLRMIVGSR